MDRVEEVGRAMTEAEIAADLKARVAEGLREIGAIIDEGRQSGLLIRWDGMGTDQFGKTVFLNLRVEKHY